MYHIPSIRSKDFVHRAVIIKNETFPIDPEKNCVPRGAIPSNAGRTIDIILDRRPIDRYCLLALTSGGAAILNRSPAPFTVMCLAGAMSCQRI